MKRIFAIQAAIAGTVIVAVLLPAANVSAQSPTVGKTVTVGQTVDNPVRCQAGSPGPYDSVQAATTGSPRYEIPADGLLTSWSTRAGSDGGQIQLEVWRPTGAPDTYALVGISSPQQLTVGVLNTFPLSPRIRVQAGDILGFRQLSDLLDCGQVTDDPGDVWATNHAGGPAPTPGTVETLTQQANLRINISATLKVAGGPKRAAETAPR